MKPGFRCLAACLLAAYGSSPAFAQDEPEASPPHLIELAGEFHTWLEANQPVSRFAVLRTQRPPGWAPDWTPPALQQRKIEYLQFQTRLKAGSGSEYGVGDRVDEALVGMAMQGIQWELEVLGRPRRDPGFYLDQTLGSLFELLVQSPQPTEREMEELIRRLHRFPAVINAAKLGLDKTVPVLAEAAIARMGDVDARVDALQAALAPLISDRLQYDFNVGIRAARQSLSSFKDWLEVSSGRFEEPAAIGVQRYRWYLGYVALVPDTVESLQAESEFALARASAQMATTRHRFAELPPPAPLANMDRLQQMAEISEQELAAFLESARLASLTGPMRAFDIAPLPPTLAAIADAGEPIEFSSDNDGGTLLYLPAEQNSAGYPQSLAWLDPRLLIAWDGFPGKNAQMQAASGHPRSLRRSPANASLSDGLALYFHEQISEAGLYAFKPASMLLALGLIRYRAALAVADIRLATGDWSVAQAVDFLSGSAGLDRDQAVQKAWNLAAFPGQAAAALAAHGEAIRFLADASEKSGDDFSLLEFNDRLLENANVPVALQRWEYLGFDDELDRLEEQRGRPATVPQ